MNRCGFCLAFPPKQRGISTLRELTRKLVPPPPPPLVANGRCELASALPVSVHIVSCCRRSVTVIPRVGSSLQNIFPQRPPLGFGCWASGGRCGSCADRDW